MMRNTMPVTTLNRPAQEAYDETDPTGHLAN